jgi:hypothetical protein
VVGLVDVERRHIEAFKAYLPTRPGKNGVPPLSPATIRITLGTLRTFFERVSEWGYDDAPTRVLIFNGDLPTPDDPLPKFLSDVDAGKLMRAAASSAPYPPTPWSSCRAGTSYESRSGNSTTTATSPSMPNSSTFSKPTTTAVTTTSTG